MQVKNMTRGYVLADRLRVADTVWSRMRGLLGYPPLRPGEGLWICPSQGVHTLGMRYPIDVLFLNRYGRVIYLYEDLAPLRFTKIRFGAKSIIELPVNSISQSRTHIGDQIAIGESP
ncbi:MAG: DUF192 domain-containing protein [Acidobacteria bacterium]|nr:DUF192 domain-containing protein [Acidobacteriota bacterium]MBI3657971.1 DUF192 domain-containing protein [Acidobacteriota bacterium]